MADVTIEGTCDARFARVREAFADNFASRRETGASVALALDGRIVVDLWGGWADKARTRPWTRDTIVNVYSTTKGLTAICAHRLAGEGRLDLDAPVAKYWPEFAANGKDRITVRATAEPSRRPPRDSQTACARGPLRLANDDRRAGGRGAVVGAGHQARLPCAHFRLPGRRSDPPDHRARAPAVISRTKSRRRSRSTRISGSRRARTAASPR